MKQATILLFALFGILVPVRSAEVPAKTWKKGMPQRCLYENDFYCHHIIAVDANGSALLPHVSYQQKDGVGKYHVETIPLDGEEVRGAKVDSAALAKAVATNVRPNPPPFNQAMRTDLDGRKPLFAYLDAMFRDIALHKPKEIVIYIHGGLNSINGAVEKSALLADTLEREGDGRYFIGICWDSDLFRDYGEHLFKVRDGLNRPSEAIVTSPLMLLSDFGGAAARLPLNIAKFWYQDGYTVNPNGYKRTQLANVRFNQINSAPANTALGRMIAADPGENADQTSRMERSLNFCSWIATEPTKLPLTLVLDGLAAQPWKNMLRRTRTMFERESEFLPQLDWCDVKNLAAYTSGSSGATQNPVALLESLNYTGRTGALEEFCYYAQSRLNGKVGAQQKVTLVGHSMGAIVACELVSRFHQLPLDNLVFEAAACSINDFKRCVIPFMEEQNLREQLWDEFKREYKITNGPSIQPRKTKFFNLCLHDNAENGERNPGNLDIVQRGSLLTWIDLLYQSPESENDRTLGRWVNSILMTDNLPKDILSRITIKEFGRNRLAKGNDVPEYGYNTKNGKFVLEPMKHGDFTRFGNKPKDAKTNLEFWSEPYREPERKFLNETVKSSQAGCHTPSAKNERKTIDGN